jgi:hypothetical protein
MWIQIVDDEDPGCILHFRLAEPRMAGVDYACRRHNGGHQGYYGTVSSKKQRAMCAPDTG